MRDIIKKSINILSQEVIHRTIDALIVAGMMRHSEREKAISIAKPVIDNHLNSAYELTKQDCLESQRGKDIRVK